MGLTPVLAHVERRSTSLPHPSRDDQTPWLVEKVTIMYRSHCCVIYTRQHILYYYYYYCRVGLSAQMCRHT